MATGEPLLSRRRSVVLPVQPSSLHRQTAPNRRLSAPDEYDAVINAASRLAMTRTKRLSDCGTRADTSTARRSLAGGWHGARRLLDGRSDFAARVSTNSGARSSERAIERDN